MKVPIDAPRDPVSIGEMNPFPTLCSAVAACLVVTQCSPAPEVDPSAEGSTPVLKLEEGESVSIRNGEGANPTGMSPMDVVSGQAPGAAAAAPKPAVSSSTSKPPLPPGMPDLDNLVGEGNWSIKQIGEGTAGPGEGPRGPDGKVIDPQAFLKQLEAQKEAQGAPEQPTVPGDQTIQLNPLDLQQEATEGRRLDASEAPSLPKKTP